MSYETHIRIYRGFTVNIRTLEDDNGLFGWDCRVENTGLFDAFSRPHTSKSQAISDALADAISRIDAKLNT